MNHKLNNEDIAIMPLEELESRYQSLVSYIERERRRKNLHTDLEVEACYLFREIEYRQVVKKNHVEYLKNFLSNFQDLDYDNHVNG